MKLSIGDYEVDIKAKHNWEEKFNKDTTLAFLNELCITYLESADYRRNLGLTATSKDFLEKEKEIFRFCEKKGYYKNI